MMKLINAVLIWGVVILAVLVPGVYLRLPLKSRGGGEIPVATAELAVLQRTSATRKNYSWNRGISPLQLCGKRDYKGNCSRSAYRGFPGDRRHDLCRSYLGVPVVEGL